MPTAADKTSQAVILKKRRYDLIKKLKNKNLSGVIELINEGIKALEAAYLSLYGIKTFGARQQEMDSFYNEHFVSEVRQAVKKGETRLPSKIRDATFITGKDYRDAETDALKGKIDTLNNTKPKEQKIKLKDILFSLGYVIKSFILEKPLSHFYNWEQLIDWIINCEDIAEEAKKTREAAKNKFDHNHRQYKFFTIEAVKQYSRLVKAVNISKFSIDFLDVVKTLLNYPYLRRNIEDLIIQPHVEEGKPSPLETIFSEFNDLNKRTDFFNKLMGCFYTPHSAFLFALRAEKHFLNINPENKKNWNEQIHNFLGDSLPINKDSLRSLNDISRVLLKGDTLTFKLSTSIDNYKHTVQLDLESARNIFEYITEHPNYIKLQGGLAVNSSKISEAMFEIGGLDKLVMIGFDDRDNFTSPHNYEDMHQLCTDLSAISKKPNKLWFTRNHVIDISDANGLYFLGTSKDAVGSHDKPSIHFRLKNGDEIIVDVEDCKLNFELTQFAFLAAKREQTTRQNGPSHPSQQTQLLTGACVNDKTI